MTPLEWTLLVILSMLFGSSFFYIGVAVKEVPTFTIVVVRVAIAAVILLASHGCHGNENADRPTVVGRILRTGTPE